MLIAQACAISCGYRLWSVRLLPADFARGDIVAVYSGTDNQVLGNTIADNSGEGILMYGSNTVIGDASGGGNAVYGNGGGIVVSLYADDWGSSDGRRERPNWRFSIGPNLTNLSLSKTRLKWSSR